MTDAAQLHLVTPARAHLNGFIDAVAAGWSPSTVDPEAGRRAVNKIANDADAYLCSLDDREGKGPPNLGPNGEVWPRIPGFSRWLWDGDFCGSISLRWEKGSSVLPPHVSGHVGYSVVPWKQRRGYATRALAMLLLEAKALGLAHLDITTTAENPASQKVIRANGGDLIDAAFATAHLSPRLLFRIRLDGSTP